MKSPLDDAKLRLSAVHPEMSHLEKERAATRIAASMTAAELQVESENVLRQLQQTNKLYRRLEIQASILARANDFQQQRNIS